MKNNELAVLLEKPMMDIRKPETLLTTWLDAEEDTETANMISIALDYADSVQVQLAAVLSGEK
ncbi:hypothetical protein [Morganella psychrotolerans]|uniref:hypothetical protein n=1 Tax=Morganella psychrotolerans TaxID=368603 RepID=UPI0039B05AAA